MPPQHGRENPGYGELHQADYKQWAREQYGTHNPGSESWNGKCKMNVMDWSDLYRSPLQAVRPSISPATPYPSIQSQLSCEEQSIILFFVLGLLLVVLGLLYSLKGKEQQDDIITLI